MAFADNIVFDWGIGKELTPN